MTAGGLIIEVKGRTIRLGMALLQQLACVLFLVALFLLLEPFDSPISDLAGTEFAADRASA